jgi:hypothetical protein
VSAADTGTTYVYANRFNFYGSGTAQSNLSGAMYVGLAANTGGQALTSINSAHFKAGSSSTYTDIVSSGTVTNASSSIFTPGTFAARLATTYTTAATVYISAAPTAGTNVTLTNAYALYVAAGASYFGGTSYTVGQTSIGVSPTIIPDGSGASLSKFQIVGSGANNSRASGMVHYGSTPIWYLQAALGTSASPTTVASGTGLGTLQFSGYDGTSFLNAATIQAFADNTVSTGNMPGRLGFYTTGATGSTPSERFRIDSTGNTLNVSTGGLGYGTGAGGTVTQGTSRTTGVTLNKTTGAITMFTAAGSATPATFTVTSSAIAATDVIILNIKSGATNTYVLSVTTVAAGSFNITFYTTGGTASDTPVINFAVIKGATA